MSDVGATLAAWRVQGADRFDPVRFRRIEAMARRAEDCEAMTRAIVDVKLGELLASYRDDLEQARKVTCPRAARAPGRLAALLDHIAAAAGPSPGLKALRLFKSTWSSLNADRRLTQARALLPDNAGPLHSQRVVHRALTTMRELSPEYLDHFMAHVDALLWMDEAKGGLLVVKGNDVVAAPTARKKARRKPA